MNPMTDNKRPMIVPRRKTPGEPRLTSPDSTHASREKRLQTGIRQKLLELRAVNSERHDPMPNHTELRKATRYQFTCAAVIRWLDADNQVHETTGDICNISTCGVFVETTARLRLATNVELAITPPSLQPFAHPLSLYFEGRVVRIEERPQRTGFAVAGCLSFSGRGDPSC